MGYIYIIKMGSTDYYKVGSTRDNDTMETRLSELQTGNPMPLKFASIIEDDMYRSVETRTHRKLNDYRMMGEWFHCDFELIYNTIQMIRIEMIDEYNVDKSYPCIDIIPSYTVLVSRRGQEYLIPDNLQLLSKEMHWNAAMRKGIQQVVDKKITSYRGWVIKTNWVKEC